MLHNAEILASELTNILQGTYMVTEEDMEVIPSTKVKMPPSFLSKINAVITTEPVLKNTIVQQNIMNLQTSSIQASGGVSLEEKGNHAFDLLVKTVQPYTREDWEDAYMRIGFVLGKSSPDKTASNVCLAHEIELMAKNNSWYLTYHCGDSYIFNGEFWILLEKKQMKSFLENVSLKMGIPKYISHSVKFYKDLYEQVVHNGFYMRNIVEAQKVLLNMRNGTLEISNNGIYLRPFYYKDFLTHQLEFEYDASSINMEWLSFLNEILPEKDTQKTLQQALGSLLLRGLKLEKVIFLYGAGANGKSVIHDVLSGLLGDESLSNYSINNLTDEHGYFRAKLKDKLINYGTDIDLSKINAGVFKTLASGEPINCRLPYKEPFIMKNYAKLIFNLNEISDAKIENTHGFFRRFLFIPFETTIPKNKQDKQLAKKLLHNKAGILNWILDGAKEVIENEEIFESQECQDFLLKFKKEPTTLERFLLENQVEVSSTQTILSSELYEKYNDMSIKLDVKPMSLIMFSKKMTDKGFSKMRTSQGVEWEVGVAS